MKANHQHVCTEYDRDFPCDRLLVETSEDVWDCGLDPIQCPSCVDWAMAQAMEAFGGSFVQQLGKAWQVADAVNRAKLVECFEEYAEQYRELARLKRART